MVGCQTTTACLFDLGNEALLIDRVTPMRKTNVEGRLEVGGLLGGEGALSTPKRESWCWFKRKKMRAGYVASVLLLFLAQTLPLEKQRAEFFLLIVGSVIGYESIRTRSCEMSMNEKLE